jgi:predicted RNase H-like HicB family nuclease
MQIKDLTIQELQNLIRLTVIETLDDYLKQPEIELEVSPIIQQQLIQISENRQKKDETIISAEAYQLLDYYLSLKYAISIIPEDKGGFTALIPDLPGCMTQGKTMEKVVTNIEEARQLWIETVYLSGKREIPLPNEKK